MPHQNKNSAGDVGKKRDFKLTDELYNWLEGKAKERGPMGNTRSSVLRYCIQHVKNGECITREDAILHANLVGQAVREEMIKTYGVRNKSET